MEQKPLLLSDVPRDIISQWNELPVDIDDLKELTEMIVNPWHTIATMTNIEHQINIIISRLEHLRFEPMTLEQYAYSFLYFDSQKMRNIYKVIYDYFENNQSQKKEEITISLVDDDEDVSEIIIVEDDNCQPATSSQSTKDGRICGICFEREVDGIILPCAHMCCYQCASDKRIKLCPEFSCRKPVEKVIKGQFI